ncbi:MAG: carbamate kinase [Phycisphaerae bacterium]|nr:carbamate kinase [Phycisphaerae bacterium]NUQ47383.1 carbamate kinase [Phycisphaerae bacterium]
MRTVIALGGNAVTRPGEEGTIPQQFEATRQTCRPLADLIVAGHQLIITHGNGPQVGNVVRRSEIARLQHIYPIPLDIAVSDTQGGMGYMIAQCLMNELAERGRPRLCATIITTVAVDPDDPSFATPTKPIGAFFSAADAEEHVVRDGWRVMEDAGRGWRRVVPSPIPLEIVELPMIRLMVDEGELVVACGGGGIPVRRDGHGGLIGVEAVIDKDRTSAILAAGVDVDALLFLTAVDTVQIDYNTPRARAMPRMTTAEAQRWLAEGQFPPGSMGPKIEAAIDFLNRSRKPEAFALITSCEKLREGLDGACGTRIVRG